jgi:hypothetical protein
LYKTDFAFASLFFANHAKVHQGEDLIQFDHTSLFMKRGRCGECNAMVFSRGKGPFFFLTYIPTNLPVVQADPPAQLMDLIPPTKNIWFDSGLKQDTGGLPTFGKDRAPGLVLFGDMHSFLAIVWLVLLSMAQLHFAVGSGGVTGGKPKYE